MTPAFEIIDIRRGITSSKMGLDRCQNQVGQVTKCRAVDGTLFYVREALDGRQSFYVSSNGRLGFKARGAKASRQVLHLATAGDFDAIAELVRNADTLRRPVIRNRRFTVAIAEAAIANA